MSFIKITGWDSGNEQLIAIDTISNIAPCSPHDNGDPQSGSFIAFKNTSRGLRVSETFDELKKAITQGER